MWPVSVTVCDQGYSQIHPRRWVEKKEKNDRLMLYLTNKFIGIHEGSAC